MQLHTANLTLDIHSDEAEFAQLVLDRDEAVSICLPDGSETIKVYWNGQEIRQRAGSLSKHINLPVGEYS